MRRRLWAVTNFDTRVDTLAWLMVVLVSGVGVAVLVYSAAYFSASPPFSSR